MHFALMPGWPAPRWLRRMPTSSCKYSCAANTKSRQNSHSRQAAAFAASLPLALSSALTAQTLRERRGTAIRIFRSHKPPYYLLTATARSVLDRSSISVRHSAVQRWHLDMASAVSMQSCRGRVSMSDPPRLSAPIFVNLTAICWTTSVSRE